MRGNPLIRFAIVLALFLFALIPMLKLTAPRAAEAAPTAINPATAALSVPTQIELTGSQPMAKFALRHLGKVVWEGSGDKSATTLTLPNNAFDLEVLATWTPDGAPEKALRVRVSRDDLPLADSTFWGQTEIEEVLSVPAN